MDEWTNDIFWHMTYSSPPWSETLHDERISVGGRFAVPRVSTPRGKPRMTLFINHLVCLLKLWIINTPWTDTSTCCCCAWVHRLSLALLLWAPLISMEWPTEHVHWEKSFILKWLPSYFPVLQCHFSNVFCGFPGGYFSIVVKSQLLNVAIPKRKETPSKSYLNVCYEIVLIRGWVDRKQEASNSSTTLLGILSPACSAAGSEVEPESGLTSCLPFVPRPRCGEVFLFREQRRREQPDLRLDTRQRWESAFFFLFFLSVCHRLLSVINLAPWQPAPHDTDLLHLMSYQLLQIRRERESERGAVTCHSTRCALPNTSVGV